MKKVEIEKKGALRPMPKVLVSCRDEKGRNKARAVGYCGNCSFDPPMVMVGIVPSRFSYEMIKKSGCFVLNLASKANRELFDYMGSHSGRDEDKFAACSVNWSDGEVVNAPLLDDCPVCVECSIVDSILTGSHEMFVGKVEKVHADPAVLGEDGRLDESKLDLL